MNKSIFYIGILLVTYLSSNSYADDQVTININAKVIESTCTVSAESVDFIVDMVVGDARNVSINTPFGKTPFSIYLEDCPVSVQKVHVKFTGTSDTTYSNLIQINNNGTTDATGIAIGLYDLNNNNINITNNLTDFNVNSSNIKVELGFIAAYVKTSTQYTPGKVTGVANFEISYN